MKSHVSLEEIYGVIDSYLPRVEQVLLEIISTPNELTRDVIHYFFSSRGKYLRPALTILGASLSDDFGDHLERQGAVIKAAAAFEIFHSATLIHDDIIDSSHLRRNRPTVNVQWGPQAAVLVGDFLHDRALSAIFSLRDERVIDLFLKTACEVCDGEIQEFRQKNNFHLTEAQYFEIIDKKTAALLATCIESGGLLGGLNPPETMALRQYGRLFGQAFQIVDDCLDLIGQEYEFGKTLGSDYAQGTLTLPVIRLLSLAGESEKSEILSLFKSRDAEEFLGEMVRCLGEQDCLQYAFETAREKIEEAKETLSLFPEGPVRRSLETLGDFVLERSR